ncbi:hypothetical protein [Halochromatium salexigens]|nr:hypothetical protein [Halochromatium salexigens]
MVDTLDDLGLGYVDPLLMNWPGGFGAFSLLQDPTLVAIAGRHGKTTV